MWTVRRYEAADRTAVVALSDRLLTGAPSWRDHGRWLTTVRGWVLESVEAADQPGHALLTVSEDRRLAGFVSIGTRSHFIGDLDAYVGELVVAEWAEGRGAGRALLQAAEKWATANGHSRLTLETGAGNDRARRFYARAGYLDEDVRLTKLL